MGKFMGVNIAGLVNKHIGGRLNDLQLVRVTSSPRDPDSPTSGTVKRRVTYTVKGFVESYSNNLIDGTIIKKYDRKINIIALSIPGLEIPRPGDIVITEGRSDTILAVERDPAGAMYTCQGRASGQ